MIFWNLLRGDQASELLNIACQVERHFFRRPANFSCLDKWGWIILQAWSWKLPGWPPDILAPHIPANIGALCCKKEFWCERSFFFLQERSNQGPDLTWTWQLRVTLDSIRNSSSRTIWNWPLGGLSSCESPCHFSPTPGQQLPWSIRFVCLIIAGFLFDKRNFTLPDMRISLSKYWTYLPFWQPAVKVPKEDSTQETSCAKIRARAQKCW